MMSEKLRLIHLDGSFTEGFVKWVVHDCGCGGKYHGTCGDLRAELDENQPIVKGKRRE